MSTELAIAAVKAQALWDAGEALRKQAAELHPEFARMLGVQGEFRNVIIRLNGDPLCGPDAVSRITSDALDAEDAVLRDVLKLYEVLRRQADAGVVAAEAVE